ncbi:MAG: hypothetical protein RR949_06285, partial [Oscillospiraceae bacterium]
NVGTVADFLPIYVQLVQIDGLELCISTEKKAFTVGIHNGTLRFSFHKKVFILHFITANLEIFYSSDGHKIVSLRVPNMPFTALNCADFPPQHRLTVNTFLKLIRFCTVQESIPKTSFLLHKLGLQYI